MKQLLSIDTSFYPHELSILKSTRSRRLRVLFSFHKSILKIDGLRL
ncbi:MAG: hypothetical protein UZ19_OD1000592 [Parcubacteria bacterium OLB19]|nr:MAG: hypothetical protein UZ19_OD1000592 [Parcubacteria bacterium OLB19]